MDISIELKEDVLRGKRDFNILYWNIHGQHSRTVGDKFIDKDFLQICNGHDLIGIGELHTNVVSNISGFKRIQQKFRKKRGQKFREA